jgi:hypothetical protein
MWEEADAEAQSTMSHRISAIKFMTMSLSKVLIRD